MPIGHQTLLDHTLCSIEAEWKDGLRPARSSDRREPLGNLVDRVVPGHGLEHRIALGSDTPQRRLDPVWVIHAVEEPVDLGAECSLGGGVLPVAPEANRSSVPHRDVPDARIRAVVVA